MVCEYLVRENGKLSCKAYGKLERVSQEKISECESNFSDCFESVDEFLKRKKSEEKGIGDYFTLNL